MAFMLVSSMPRGMFLQARLKKAILGKTSRSACHPRRAASLEQ
jgi:hypothetical protein